MAVKEASTTKTAADLVREAQLNKMASLPIGQEEAIDEYEVVNSCAGHTWRRKKLPGGGFGPWEDLGPTRAK